MTPTPADVLAPGIDTRLSLREGFTRDETGLRGRMPRGVVHARSTADVVECVRWAGTVGVPVIRWVHGRVSRAICSRWATR